MTQPTYSLPRLAPVYGKAYVADLLLTIVGQCFKDNNNQLNVSYAITPAFG